MSRSSDAVWDVVQGRYDASKLEALLHGVSISGWEMDGWTPLHYACENKDVTSLRPLLNAGSTVNAVDEHGYTPLHLLCKNNSGIFTGIAELLSSGASVNAVSSDNRRVTPLQLLCMNESITRDALSAMLKANADVSAVDGDGNTALHSLCANHSIHDALLAVYLTRPGTLNTPNQFKATPLHYLCQNARVSPAMLKLLLDARADPNLPDNTGNTSLHALCDNSAVTVAHLQVMLALPSIDLLATNASGRRAAASLETDECIAYIEQFSSHDASVLLPTSSTVPGGEDVADLPEPLQSIMAQWNESLPPFDEAFYTAISCEPAFEGIYSQVQHASVHVAEHPSDKTLLSQWNASMSEWRQTIVRAFLTLVNPRLWASYAKTFQRRVPDDVVKVQPKVEAIWAKFPDASQRRERLEAVHALY